MTNRRFVAYYRVSTAKQGDSGLGLEAQQAAVRSYLNGGRWKLVSELTEIESGKRNDRPQLAEALVQCRIHGATLIIAKLDRLARNVAFYFEPDGERSRLYSRRLPSSKPSNNPYPRCSR